MFSKLKSNDIATILEELLPDANQVETDSESEDDEVQLRNVVSMQKADTDFDRVFTEELQNDFDVDCDDEGHIEPIPDELNLGPSDEHLENFDEPSSAEAQNVGLETDKLESLESVNASQLNLKPSDMVPQDEEPQKDKESRSDLQPSLNSRSAEFDESASEIDNTDDDETYVPPRNLMQPGPSSAQDEPRLPPKKKGPKKGACQAERDKNQTNNKVSKTGNDKTVHVPQKTGQNKKPSTKASASKNSGKQIVNKKIPTQRQTGVNKKAATANPAKPKINEAEATRKWRKKETATTIPIYSLSDGPVQGHFEGCHTPTDFFLQFIDDSLENIIYQSNLYATTKGKTLNLQKNELCAFIGINFLMGYHKLPSWRDYWSTSEDLEVPVVREVMARNRFDTILSHLHVADNSAMPADNTDKLYKIRPLIDSVNKRCYLLYHGTRELSVDESMILFKGRSSIKQYNPMKPIKRGYKLWCIADLFGYIKQFSVYQGKDEVAEEKFANYGLGERVVLSLTEKEWGKNKIIFFDNFFNSLPLLERLKTEKTLACGTIKSIRKGLPAMMQDADMTRGDVDHKTSCHGITYYKWFDSKGVFLASNYHGTELTEVERRDDSGSKKKVKAPAVVKDYNRCMGGVDHADQLRSAYGVSRRSKKWWHRIFWGIMDIAFVNSYVVYCRSLDENEKKPTLLDYRRDVTRGLMSMKSVTPKKGLKRKAGSSPKVAPSKRRGKDTSVPDDVRLGNLGVHWPVFNSQIRLRCEMCALKGVQSRPYSKCSHCGVHLCCNDKKNCFNEYHGLDEL